MAFNFFFNDRLRLLFICTNNDDYQFLKQITDNKWTLELINLVTEDKFK